jgi:pyrrolidone-carboxylate peptidase
MRTIALSLGRTKATTILYQLTDNSIVLRYLLFKNNLTFFEKKIIEYQPEHILMLGLYSGRDRTHIRIEKEYQHENVVYPIPAAFTTDETFMTAQSIGTGQCNFYTAAVCEIVKRISPKTRVTFLHIPKMMPANQAVSAISQQL